MRLAAIRLRQYQWMDVERARSVFETVKRL